MLYSIYHHFGEKSIDFHHFVEKKFSHFYNGSMKNLKSLRKSQNYTLTQLSTELGISPQVLSRYERGEREADYSTLSKIAAFFDVSIDYLLGVSTYFYPDRIKEQKSPAPTLTQAEQDLLNDFRSLPRPEQAQAAEYVHFLAERRGTKKQNA